MTDCTHLEQVRPVRPSGAGCEECLKTGDAWVHLRMCLTCGKVGCCESSQNTHALKHFQEAGHPLVRSHEPGEDWSWCYPDQTFVQVDLPPPPPDGSETRSDGGGGGSTSASVIRNYYLIAGLYTLSSSLIWGVNTLFLLEAGLDIFQVFIANSIFTGSMALFEIPTGVLADTRGRRASFLLSVAIVLLGTLGYVAAAALGGGLLLFGIMSVILGLGFTFYSGAVEAWLVDALNAVGFTGKLDRVFARSAEVSGVAMLIGTVSGGLLGNLDLSFPFIGRAVLLAIVFAVAYFFMHDIGFKAHDTQLAQLPTQMRKLAQDSIVYGWQQREVRLLVLTSLVGFSFMMWGFYAWQPYFLELLGRELTWVAGVIAALISVSTIVGNGLVEFFARFCGKRTTLLLWAMVVLAVAAIGVGLTSNFYIAVGLFLFTTATLGVVQPVKQAYMHQVIPSAQRATVVSFDSLVGSAGSVLGQTGLGYLSRVQGIGPGYVVGGAFSLLALPILYALRRMNSAADVIVGDPGKQSACAAQGLPAVSGVNTVAHREAGAT